MLTYCSLYYVLVHYIRTSVKGKMYLHVSNSAKADNKSNRKEETESPVQLRKRRTSLGHPERNQIVVGRGEGEGGRDRLFSRCGQEERRGEESRAEESRAEERRVDGASLSHQCGV